MTTAVPLRNEEEIRANATFDALMWALSRPGQFKIMPDAGEAALIEALIDRECRVYAADPLLMPVVMRTGAALAEPQEADHLFLGAVTNSDILKRVATGSDLYPDDGSTLIVRATLGGGVTLRLSGPGVDGFVDVQVDGLPTDFWQQRKQVMRYPTGFELILLDGNRLLALPRSTNVEVV